MLNKLICRLFGHNWMYGLGYSTNKRMRTCMRCPKQEMLE